VEEIEENSEINKTDESEIKNIKIPISIKNELDSIKIIDREPYYQVIKRLIDSYYKLKKKTR
jgi:hypothetical protein